MPKIFLSYDQQIEKLKNEKNLQIDDEAYAKEILRQTSYYSLIGGYKDIFKNPTTKKYKDGTKFEDIVELYYFDESLRQLFLKYLRFLYKGIIINHNKKPSQPTLKRRFFKKKAAFFHGPVWERSGADFILKRKGEFF